MRYGERTDAELVMLAQQGWSPAFAALLRRHGDLVYATVADQRDPLAATTDVFLRAMRRLDKLDADTPVDGWLEDVAVGRRGRRRRDRPPRASLVSGGALAGGGPGTTRASAPGAVTDGMPTDGSDGAAMLGTLAGSNGTRLSDAQRDAVWAELAHRWPNGRRPYRIPAWTIGLATVLAVVLASAGVPVLVLGGDSGEESLHADQDLLAFPVEDDDPAPIEDDEPDVVPDDVEPLPTYEFPIPPEEQAAPSNPAPAPDPGPQTEPEPVPDTDQPDGTDADGTGDGTTDGGDPTTDGATDGGTTDGTDGTTGDGTEGDGTTDGATDGGTTDGDPTTDGDGTGDAGTTDGDPTTDGDGTSDGGTTDGTDGTTGDGTEAQPTPGPDDGTTDGPSGGDTSDPPTEGSDAAAPEPQPDDTADAAGGADAAATTDTDDGAPN